MNMEVIEQLVEQAQAGDRNAFSEMVRLLMNKTVALTYKITGDSEAAVDLAQDSFLSAWINLKSFKKEAKFESWLYRIAFNKALNYKKKEQKFSDDSAIETQPAHSNPEKEYAQKELKQKILGFMNSLPSEQRLIFELHFYKQLTFEETARATGKAVGTVKTLYREAIKKLRTTAISKGWQL